MIHIFFLKNIYTFFNLVLLHLNNEGNLLQHMKDLEITVNLHCSLRLLRLQ